MDESSATVTTKNNLAGCIQSTLNLLDQRILLLRGEIKDSGTLCPWPMTFRN